jgi:ABC-2 type transport system permease protein/sodium transport system permease protein
MPVIVYPLLSLAFQKFLVTGVGGTAQESYRVGVESREDGELLGKVLRKGFEVRSRRDRGNAGAQTEAAGAEPKTSVPAQIPIKIFEGSNLEDSIASNSIDVGVRIRRKEAFRLSDLLEEGFDCELLVNESSYRSREANAFVEQLLSAVNSDLYRIQLRGLNVSGRITAVRIDRKPVEIAGIPASKAHSLATLIPLILILMTITGAVYPAIDLTAGERERGTLEILIAAPVPRLQLLLAKYTAVVTVALLTATVNLASMIVTVLSMGLGPLLFGGSGISILLVLQIFGLLLLFATFFSAVLLAVTSFARSFKEAQAYLIPLMLVSIAPGLLSMMPGLRLNGPLAVAPLVNIVLLARDLFEGEATPLLVVVVVCSTALFALAAISVAARIFGTDAILYGAQGTWSDLFRRPAQASTVPTLTSALSCLALMFPANFLLGNLIARTETADLGQRLWMISIVTILLFALFPLTVAVLNRVRIAGGFRMQPAAA